MQLYLLLTISVFASEGNKLIKRASEPNILEINARDSVLVKIEEDEYNKTKNSHFIGVSYNKRDSIWRTSRWSTNEKKTIANGTYKCEETAGLASDTLAKKLIANGEQCHELNFPDNDTEVYAEKKASYYIGVSYHKQNLKWCAVRRSKKESKDVNNGSYKDEKTAAHASDTLARKLTANGEKGHKLNFPYDHTEVNATEKTSKYVGVSYNKQRETWNATIWSRQKNKTVNNGSYKNEETAAHASDTLARKLIANGEKGHKLSFPDDDTEVSPKNQRKKRKRPAEFENSHT